VVLLFCSVERCIVWDRSLSNGRFSYLNSRSYTSSYVFLKLCSAEQHKMASDSVPIVGLELEVSLSEHCCSLNVLVWHEGTYRRWEVNL
jgi:hypothetical protein